jgi:glycosyltransferase involved in cell wall biosynthesis
MSVAAVMMVKDEADIIEGFVRHMVGHVDHMVVADNGSTDGTREILDHLRKDAPLTLVDDSVVAYRQSEKTTRLAHMAREMGAIWVVPADVDEIWSVVGGGTIRSRLEATRSAYRVLTAPRYTHVRTAADHRQADPFASMVWRRPEPETPPKVAFRVQPGAVVHQGNHGVTYSGDAAGPPRRSPKWPVLELAHFPVRSADQLVRKVRNGLAAYEADPALHQGWGVHWRAWGAVLARDGEDGLRAVFDRYWWYPSPVDAGLVYDPAPYRRGGGHDQQRHV